jgi:hypothetical protein
VQFEKERAKRAIIASQRTLRLRSGQAATGRTARPGPSLRKERFVQDVSQTAPLLKTVSVEAGDGFSKLAELTLLRRWSKAAWPDRSGFDSGMQKDGLTMFPLSCYSC